MDRIARIRQMIEENDEPVDLFSRRHVSHRPWDLAVKRHAKTPAEAESAVADLERVFGDLQLSVEEAVEEGDKVVVRWRLRGKLSGPFVGIKPTNRAVDFTGINIYRFVGDKIVESWGEADMATLAQQAFGGLSAEACVEALKVMSRPPEAATTHGGPA